MAVIILGPPGAGKGTQSYLLAEKLELYHLETSKILEEVMNQPQKKEWIKIKGKKYYFKKEKERWKKGILLSPPFVAYLVKKKIREIFKRGESIILSGSPRTLYEGEEIVPLLEKLYGKKNIKIILLEIPPEESIFRNSHRRICTLFRHSILYSKQTANLTECPLDGSKLVRREGLDDPETIKVRLIEYKTRTLPLLSFFEKRGLKVKKVNGMGSVSEVYQRVKKAVLY